MFNLIPYPWRRGNIAKKDDLFAVDRFFDDFFKDPFFNKLSSMTTPIRTDVRETEKEYILEAELPGINKEDILIDLKDDVLTLGVDIKNQIDNEDDGYIYKERRNGSYRRSFHVGNINNEAVKANYKDGLLTIILPKSKPEKRSRKIEIE